MATTLPTELIQSILLQLDPETYLAAHQTCQSWRRASSAPYMLRRALQQIPASLVPPLPFSSGTSTTTTEQTTPTKSEPATDTEATKTESLSPEQWTTYFAQTARLNLLGRRRHIRKSVRKVVAPRDLAMPICPSGVVQCVSEDGSTMVMLRGAKVLVFRAESAPASGFDAEAKREEEADGESEDVENFSLSHEFSLSSSLYPHWTSVCHALMHQSINGSNWSGNQRYSKHRLAVSSRGEFVAVALGRVIQVYGLGSQSRGQGHLDNPDNTDTDTATIQPPAEHVLGQHTEHIAFARSSDPTVYEDTDGVVEGLEFVDNDTLLRVAIGKESTIHRPTRVRYLGCPDAVMDGEGPGPDYWRDAIKKVYLDSAALGVSLAGSGGGARCDLRGLRLLDREMVDVRDQWEEKKDRRMRDSRSASTSTSTPQDKPNRRSFIASLQTSTADTYCIGQATSSTTTSSISVQLIRLLSSIYSRPSSIMMPITPQTKDYPCLYAYPHRPDGTNTNTTRQSQPYTSQSPSHPQPRQKITHTYNLQTTLPRFTSTNLPSGTFSSALLAVSDDAQILVIYEPDHACCVVEGGALYVCFIGSCRSVYQPGFAYRGNTEEGEGKDFNSNIGSNADGEGGGGGRGGGGKDIYPRRDIIPTWPFLLDRVSVNVESLKVKRVTGKSWGSKYRYAVMGIAGDEEMEWLF